MSQNNIHQGLCHIATFINSFILHAVMKSKFMSHCDIHQCICHIIHDGLCHIITFTKDDVALQHSPMIISYFWNHDYNFFWNKWTDCLWCMVKDPYLSHQVTFIKSFVVRPWWNQSFCHIVMYIIIYVTMWHTTLSFSHWYIHQSWRHIANMVYVDHGFP